MLLLHILTATVTLLICTYSWFRPTRQTSLVLNIFTILSLGSGVFLTLDASVLTRAFCIKLGVYLLLIALTRYRLDFFLKNSIVNRVSQKR